MVDSGPALMLLQGLHREYIRRGKGTRGQLGTYLSSYRKEIPPDSAFELISVDPQTCPDKPLSEARNNLGTFCEIYGLLYICYELT